MAQLLHGNCIEEMKQLENRSVDLIFCDLPYATKSYSAVNCKWNTPIDLDAMWKEFMRIKGDVNAGNYEILNKTI